MTTKSYYIYRYRNTRPITYYGYYSFKSLEEAFLFYSLSWESEYVVASNDIHTLWHKHNFWDKISGTY